MPRELSGVPVRPPDHVALTQTAGQVVGLRPVMSAAEHDIVMATTQAATDTPILRRSKRMLLRKTDVWRRAYDVVRAIGRPILAAVCSLSLVSALSGSAFPERYRDLERDDSPSFIGFRRSRRR